MAATRTSHRAAPERRPAGALRRLLSRLGRHPLADGSRHRRRRHPDRLGLPERPWPRRQRTAAGATPTFDDCAATTCSSHGEGTGNKAQYMDDADSAALLRRRPSLPHRRRHR